MGAVYYNDHDPQACAWLRALIAAGQIPAGDVDERSILDVAPSDLKGYRQCHFFAGIGGWAYALQLARVPTHISLWTGSPPCQPFSAVGKQKGRHDARHLAPHFLDLVRACRPSLLFGEQVASSAVLGKTASSSRRNAAAPPAWAWLDDLSDRLEAAHYAVGASDIPAAGVGAPHIRQRVFFGAVRLADGFGTGLERHARHGRDGDRPGRLGADAARPAAEGGSVGELVNSAPGGRREECPVGGRLGSAHGGWADADWLLCRDGVWRPVEPGTFPLAHGVPARVGRLRGYGNAIVPQAAAAFVRAFLTTLKHMQAVA
jgi:DNA (cytosine-5)-methyltransferase 1